MSAVRAFPGYPAPWRVRFGRVGGIATCIGGAVYLLWRVRQLPELGAIGWIFFALELFSYVNFLGALPLMWAPRPRRWAPPPHGTLDVFITVCGETPAMVEATVRAALDIDYPHHTYVCNDGRIARKDGWEQIDALAERLGVRCFTRTDGFRGKAGNLNHALRHSNGDFVCVIDADHLASPDLAEDLLGHLHPRVAFVCTRQAFHDTPATEMLGNAEGLFYSVIQPAKDRDNAAFSCGNGVVYRREALDDVGGFSEWNLVEDLHTSYLLHSKGWQSVYVPRAVTIGTAPETAAELAAQRLRWATDSMRLFFWDCPLLNRRLTVRQRMHYAQTAGLYYMTTCIQILFVLCPVLSVFTGLEVMRPNTGLDYAWHVLAFMVPMTVLLVSYAGFAGAARLLQMQAFLAPITCLAAWRALRMRPGAKKQRRASGVTSKTSQQLFNRITLVQNLLLLLLLATIGKGLASAGGPEWGSVLWACAMAAMIAPFNGMVSLRTDVAQSARIALTAPALVALPLALLAMWSPFPGADTTGAAAQGQPSGLPSGPSAPAAPLERSKLRAPRHGVYLGTYRPKLAYASDARPRLNVSSYGDTELRILHRFQSWFNDDPNFDTAWADKVNDLGAVPMITWEPWEKPPDSVSDPDQRPGLLAAISRGKYDRYVRRYAKAVAAYRHPVVLRLMHEMNGNWYPWQVNGNGNTPAQYRQAWIHVHRIFDRAHATNVSWEFSIDSLGVGALPSRQSLDAYYPGDRYVDWVGVSGFNWGPSGAYPVWRNLVNAFTPAYAALASFHRPVMLSEAGTVATGGDPAQWMRTAMSDIRTRMPAVKAVVWFDADTPDADFRLNAATLHAMAGAARSRWYTPPLRRRYFPG